MQEINRQAGGGSKTLTKCISVACRSYQQGVTVSISAVFPNVGYCVPEMYGTISRVAKISNAVPMVDF